MDILDFVTWGIFGFFLIGVVVLIVATYMNYDFSFIRENPLVFVMEIIVICILPAATFLVMIGTRNLDSLKTTKLAGLLAVKFATLHLLLQTSGYYSYILT